MYVHKNIIHIHLINHPFVKWNSTDKSRAKECVITIETAASDKNSFNGNVYKGCKKIGILIPFSLKYWASWCPHVIHMSVYYLLVNEGLNIYDYPISVLVVPSSFQSHINSCQNLLFTGIGTFLILYENLYSRHEALHFMVVTFRESSLVFLRCIKGKVIGEGFSNKMAPSRVLGSFIQI